MEERKKDDSRILQIGRSRGAFGVCQCNGMPSPAVRAMYRRQDERRILAGENRELAFSDLRVRPMTAQDRQPAPEMLTAGARLERSWLVFLWRGQRFPVDERSA